MARGRYVRSFRRHFKQRPRKPGLRTVGIELEFPVIAENGEAVGYDIIDGLFDWLGRRGWRTSTDGGTGRTVAAENPAHWRGDPTKTGSDVISTDVGYSIIEASLSPDETLDTVAEHWQALKSLLCEYFGAHNCHVLGYGLQPISRPSDDLIADKGRYAFFRADSLNRFVDQRFGTDLSLFSIAASSQCHIDVYRHEAVTAVNVANGLAPLLSALTANASVWKGAVDPEWTDVREIFWDRTWSNRIEQVGIPDEFRDFTDYVDRLCAFRPLMVKREGEFIKINNARTFGEYLDRRGRNSGSTVGGAAVPLTSGPKDLDLHTGFAWWDARLTAYGTLEVRPCSEQPGEATTAVAALALGLVENLTEATELYRTRSVPEWRRLRFDVLRHGLGASADQTPVTDLAAAVLTIARDGLRRRQLGEESHLKVLADRLDARATLADRVAAAFDPANLGPFLDLVEIR